VESTYLNVPRFKWPGSEVAHPTPSSAEVTNEWNYTSALRTNVGLEELYKVVHIGILLDSNALDEWDIYSAWMMQETPRKYTKPA
jgi:hypothetical protein